MDTSKIMPRITDIFIQFYDEYAHYILCLSNKKTTLKIPYAQVTNGRDKHKVTGQESLKPMKHFLG